MFNKGINKLQIDGIITDQGSAFAFDGKAHRERNVVEAAW
jgi:hypothetical protein